MSIIEVPFPKWNLTFDIDINFVKWKKKLPKWVTLLEYWGTEHLPHYSKV